MPLLVGSRRALLGGAVAVPFPRSLGNLALWLDATKLTGINDGDAIATWIDQSGAGHDATQAGAGKPTYKTAIQNGLPIVRFNGSSTFLNIPAIDLTGTTGISVYAVVKNITAATRIMFEMSANQGSFTDSFVLYPTSASKLVAEMLGDVGTSQFTSTATVTTTAHQISAVFDKSLAINEAVNWIDGATAGAYGGNANNTNAFGNRVLYLGARGGTLLFFPGDIGELLLFSTAHGSTVRASIEASLKAKWGTP